MLSVRDYPNLEARLRLVAWERAIPQDELQRALRDDDELIDFCCRHHVSVDWLVLGDLRGLRRMKKWWRFWRAF